MAKKKRGPRRPAKHPDLLALMRERLLSGNYRDTRHVSERRLERAITLPEVRQVLLAGFHESRKDEYKPEYHAWSYAIRGRTIDLRELRVVVSFDSSMGELLLLITAVDLTQASD